VDNVGISAEMQKKSWSRAYPRRWGHGVGNLDYERADALCLDAAVWIVVAGQILS
jgi:hypothetical protein